MVQLKTCRIPLKLIAKRGVILILVHAATLGTSAACDLANGTKAGMRLKLSVSDVHMYED